MVNQRDSEFPGHPASKGFVSPIYDGRTGHCLNNSSFDPYASDGSNSPSLLVKFEEDVVIIDGIPVSGNNRSEYGGWSSLTPLSNNAGGASSGRGSGRANSPMTPISNAGGASSGRGFGRAHSLMLISNSDSASSGRGFGQANSPMTPISNADGASSSRGFGRANSPMTPISNAGGASSGSGSGSANSSMTPSNTGDDSSGRGSGSKRPNTPIARSGWSISTSLPVTEMSNLTNSSEGSSSLAPSNTAEVESALERSSASFVKEFPPLTPSRKAALPTTPPPPPLPQPPPPPRASLRFNQLFGVTTPRRQIPDTAKEVKQLSAATINPSCTIKDPANEVKLVTDTAKEANQPSTGTTPFPFSNDPPGYKPWSPEEDEILVWPDLPKEKQPSRQHVDDFINKRLYGTGGRKRLPVFSNICSDSGSQ